MSGRLKMKCARSAVGYAKMTMVSISLPATSFD